MYESILLPRVLPVLYLLITSLKKITLSNNGLESYVVDNLV